VSYLTVNRGTPKRETPIDVLHLSGANIGGGANRKHWGKSFCCLCGSDGDVKRELKTRSSLLTERIARSASLVNRCTRHRSGTNPSFTESRNTRMSLLRVGNGVLL